MASSCFTVHSCKFSREEYRNRGDLYQIVRIIWTFAVLIFYWLCNFACFFLLRKKPSAVYVSSGKGEKLYVGFHCEGSHTLWWNSLPRSRFCKLLLKQQNKLNSILSRVAIVEQMESKMFPKINLMLAKPTIIILTRRAHCHALYTWEVQGLKIRFDWIDH